MKKLWLALWLLLAPSLAFAQGPPNGPAYSFPCNANVASSFITTALSPIVGGVVGKGIYLCGWHGSTLSTSAGATTFQLTFTNATTTNNCLTSTPSVALTPPNGVTSTAPSIDHNPTAGLSVPPQTGVTTPSNLCLTVGGVANLQLLLYYGQY